MLANLAKRVERLELGTRVPSVSRTSASIQAAEITGTCIGPVGTYGDPTTGTAGPEVEVQVGQTGRLLVLVYAQSSISVEITGSADVSNWMGVALSGANTRVPVVGTDGAQHRALNEQIASIATQSFLALCQPIVLEDLDPGPTTVRAQYARSIGNPLSGTLTLARRIVTAWPL
jgi:hypothetical protein